MSHPFKIAAVQACPVYLDRDATISKACRLIAQAGAAGARLVVFPEAFVPGYPLWAWFIPAGHTHPLRELYAELLANAVAVPGEATGRLCEAAREAGVVVAIGINEINSEASATSIYNTLLYIGPDGAILGKHRKVMPTGGERLVWAMGDGSDLEVYHLPFARLGGLLCWENYMPLARYAISAWGAEIFVAPTWDRGEPWLSTMRHVAKEGRCYVVGCSTPMRIDDIPDRFAFKGKYLAAVEGWINPGDSVIVDPDGKMVAGPASQQETILYADVDRSKIMGPRWQLDVAGHYARPDIFELIVHRVPKRLLTVAPHQAEEDGGDTQTNT
ncbi:MAG TPA: carbon-nitrogen hydrolase family protein [Bryobacteraceae bacterium]|nr:carbon-nitrogen hydrolase family protein [Bryobacteraceae bacterium]